MAFPRRLSANGVDGVRLGRGREWSGAGPAEARRRETLLLPDRPVPDRSKPVSDPTFLRSLLTSPWGGRIIASSPHPEEPVS